MLLVNQYKQLILDYYYIDSNYIVRYKKDGYMGRYKKDDPVKIHFNTTGYPMITLPKVRRELRYSHAIWLLSGNSIKDTEQIDHIDGNVNNNSLNNLRVVSNQVNCKNRKKRIDNTSGITGIRWDNNKQRFIIRRTVKGVRYSTSRKTLQEAIQVLNDFTNLDGEYTNRHGK